MKVKDVKGHANKIMPFLQKSFGELVLEVKEGKGKGKNIDQRCPSHVELRSEIRLRRFSEELILVRNIRK